MADKINKDELKFEDAVARLEEIVSALEGAKCDLDESLGLFEEGVSLVKYCNEKLENAQLKVRKLTEDGEVDFFAKEAEAES